MVEKMILDISGIISLDTYKYVLNKKKESNRDTEIVLVINSIGGSTSSGFEIYDLLSITKNPIYTIALGNCYSIATILFALGTKRYCSVNTEYLLHSTRQNLVNTFLTQKSAFELAKSLKADNDKIIKALLKMSELKITEKKLKSIFNSDKNFTFNSEEMLKLGIVTDILTI